MSIETGKGKRTGHWQELGPGCKTDSILVAPEGGM